MLCFACPMYVYIYAILYGGYIRISIIFCKLISDVAFTIYKHACKNIMRRFAKVVLI